MSLLAMHSTGKVPKKVYCRTACRRRGWLTPIYSPGASLRRLIEQVLETRRPHNTLYIVSNANKVVEMHWTRYFETTKDDVWKAGYRLAGHIRKGSILSHLVLFGAHVTLFKGAPFPKDYCFIQRDI